MHEGEARRFAGLPAGRVCGRLVPVADRRVARLVGLALLPRQRAGPGLLIPHCRSVHTFGMRFALDVLFLDGENRVVEVPRAVGPNRFVSCRSASAVLELPAGGEGAGAGS